MEQNDYILEHIRQLVGASKEEEERKIQEQKVNNPVLLLQEENAQLKKRVEYAEEALLALMEMGMA